MTKLKSYESRLLYMGADVIYQYKRLLPRMLIFIVLWLISIFVPLFMFGMQSWFLPWLVGDFLIMLIYIGLEYLHMSKLVKGTIGNVSISDLTKAIYWLSIAGTGKTPLGQGFFSYKNVSNVVNRIGGDLKTEWEQIREKYRLLNPRKYMLLIISLFLCSFGILLAHFLDINLVSWCLAAAALILILALGLANKKMHDTVETLIKDKSTAWKTRWMTQELLNWVSDRTAKPLQVMLAEDNYSGIKVTGSVFASVIVEIQPRSQHEMIAKRSEQTLEPAPEIPHRETEEARQQKWEPLRLALVVISTMSSLALLGLSLPFLSRIPQFSSGITGSILSLVWVILAIVLPFVPIELFFRRKHLNSSFLIVLALLLVFVGVPTLEWLGISEKMAWMSIGTTIIVISVVAFAILLYAGLPFLKLILRGGEIKPSDLERIVKRIPSRSVKAMIKKDNRFQARVDFLMTLYSRESMAVSETSEFAREWISGDSHQPSKFRYFLVKEESVMLTDMGRSLAGSLQKKLNL
jgi:hypothetical protein